MDREIGKCPALSGCGMFSDNDLYGFLHAFPDATDLDLSGSQITSDSAPLIARFTDLRELDLSDTAIDDRALHTLASMKSLLRLTVQNTAISARGLATLHQALDSHCHVAPQMTTS